MAPRETAGRPSGNGAGAHTISRDQAARDAGLSRDQKVTALRIANIPDAEFEAAVESDDPPVPGRTPAESGQNSAGFPAPRERDRTSPPSPSWGAAGPKRCARALLLRQDLDLVRAAVGLQPHLDLEVSAGEIDDDLECARAID